MSGRSFPVPMKHAPPSPGALKDGDFAQAMNDHDPRERLLREASARRSRR